MELKRLRDNSHELAMLLTEKHRELLQKQDYEVRLAMLSERGRIAREIHDHVGHLLSRSILQVGALLATQKDEGTRSALSVIRTLCLRRWTPSERAFTTCTTDRSISERRSKPLRRALRSAL